MAWGERTVASHADVVIAHFPSIAEKVDALTAGRVPAVVVPNVPLEPAADEECAMRLRRRWSPDGLPLLVYTGTFEDYQGLPLAVEAAARLKERGTRVRLLLAGGLPDQRDQLRALSEQRRVADLVAFAGVVAQDEVPDHLRAADVVVSPRASGSNTPLKLFAYLRSGRPILATRIPSHTQVLDDSTAVLVTPDAAGLAQGVLDLLGQPAAGARRAEAAAALVRGRYDTHAYVRGVAQAYEAVGGERADTARLLRAAEQLDRSLSRAPELEAAS